MYSLSVLSKSFFKKDENIIKRMHTYKYKMRLKDLTNNESSVGVRFINLFNLEQQQNKPKE